MVGICAGGSWPEAVHSPYILLHHSLAGSVRRLSVSGTHDWHAFLQCRLPVSPGFCACTFVSGCPRQPGNRPALCTLKRPKHLHATHAAAGHSEPLVWLAQRPWPAAAAAAAGARTLSPNTSARLPPAVGAFRIPHRWLSKRRREMLTVTLPPVNYHQDKWSSFLLPESYCYMTMHAALYLKALVKRLIRPMGRVSPGPQATTSD